MRKRILELLALLALAGATAAEDYSLLYREEKNMSFNMEQKVSGDGFFSVYRYALMPDLTGTEGKSFNGVEAKVKQHGSGSIDVKSGFSGESTYTNTSDLNAEPEEFERFKGGQEIEVLDEFEEETTALINLKEDGEMIYAPAAMAIDSRYYALHPLAFNSLLVEKTTIKNRNGFNSMGFKVEGAHALDRQLEAQSDLTDTSLKIEGDVTEGKASLKAVQYARSPADDEENEILGTATRDWKQPLTVFEQDYTGTYHIKHNMTMSWSDEDADIYADAWLPCCSGGYLSMPPNYQRGIYGFGSDVRRLCDCTCFKVSKNAEFPRINLAVAPYS